MTVNVVMLPEMLLWVRYPVSARAKAARAARSHRDRNRVTRFEPLEPRLPLAGAVIGLVFEDLNENGERDSGEALVGGVTVYLDVNDNGILDAGEPSDVTTSSSNGSGGNYRITNSLANGTAVAVRPNLDSARVATPALTSFDWTGRSSEVDDVVDAQGRGDTRARDITEGDFNGDGVTDTAVLQQLRDNANPASVAIFLAAADGTIPTTPTVTLPVGGLQNTPTEFFAADLNNNGTTDLVVVDSGVGQIVLLADFNGSDFAARGSISISGAVDVVVGNFDSDTDLEIAVLSKATASQITLYQPGASLSYTAGTPKATGRTNPGRMVAGHFTNDQHLDLAVFHAPTAASPNDSREIAVLPGSANGTFSNPIVSVITQRNFSSSIVAGQFAGDDSHTDLAVVSGSDVVLLGGNGAGSFSESLSIDDSEDQGKPSRLSALDVDQDGDSDLAFSSVREFSATQRFTDARVFENVGGSFVQRFRAFQINVVFSTSRVVPVLLGSFQTSQIGGDAMRLAIAAPSQDSSEEFLFAIKHSTRIAKQYNLFLGSNDITARDFGLRQAANPTLSIAATDAVKNEGDSGSTAFTFTVTRSGHSVGETSVNFTVSGSGGDPANAQDFGGTLPSGQVSFSNGQERATITILVSADTVVEPNEGFTVTLMNPSGNAIISNATAGGQILNDDAFTSSVAINSQVYGVEGTGANAIFSFTVTRTGDTNTAATVNFAVTGGGTNPANASDFDGTFPVGVVDFAPGQTQRLLQINVTGDSNVEADEEFTVTLTGASNSVEITSGPGQGLIFDDDHPGDTIVVDPTLIAPADAALGGKRAEMILLNVVAGTTLTVARLGPIQTTDPAVRIFDSALSQVTTTGDIGIYSAPLVPAKQYALLFDLVDASRVFLIRSTAAAGSLNGNVESNFILRFDVNADGIVSALDALQVINELARQTSLNLTLMSTELTMRRYFNVSGDDGVSARDALLVINELARRNSLTLSGESSPTAWEIVSAVVKRGIRDELQASVDGLLADEAFLGTLF